MSHSLVHHEHIRVLVWACLQQRFSGPVSWRFRSPDGSIASRKASTRNDRAIGLLLVAQIERTFDEHHDSDDDHAPYIHGSPVEDGWSAIEVAKALQHYSHQAFDENTNAQSNEAAMLCAALGTAIVQTILGPDPKADEVRALATSPEWEAAPLEINTGTVPAAGPRVRSPRRRPAPRTLTTLERPGGPVRPRRRSGRPTNPVPWVMTAADQVWAWDPGRGPIRLTDLDQPLGWHYSGHALSPDGTTIRYHASSSRLDRSPAELRTLDLRTGKTTTERPHRNHVRQIPHAEGTEVLVEYTDVIDHTLTRPVVHVQYRGVWRQLPSRAPDLGVAATGTLLAFSTSGDLLAVTWRWGHNPFQMTEVVDLRDGDDTGVRWAVELNGQAPWNADGSRLLVGQTQTDSYLSRVVSVWDRWQRSLEPVAVLPEHRNQDVEHLGWVDDRRLLSMITDGRQVSMRSVDPETGEQEEYAVFRRPVNRGDMHSVLMAPSVVHANSETLSG